MALRRPGTEPAVVGRGRESPGVPDGDRRHDSEPPRAQLLGYPHVRLLQGGAQLLHLGEGVLCALFVEHELNEGFDGRELRGDSAGAGHVSLYGFIPLVYASWSFPCVAGARLSRQNRSRSDARQAAHTLRNAGYGGAGPVSSAGWARRTRCSLVPSRHHTRKSRSFTTTLNLQVPSGTRKLTYQSPGSMWAMSIRASRMVPSR